HHRFLLSFLHDALPISLPLADESSTLAAWPDAKTKLASPFASTLITARFSLTCSINSCMQRQRRPTAPTCILVIGRTLLEIPIRDRKSTRLNSSHVAIS